MHFGHYLALSLSLSRWVLNIFLLRSREYRHVNGRKVTLKMKGPETARVARTTGTRKRAFFEAFLPVDTCVKVYKKKRRYYKKHGIIRNQIPLIDIFLCSNYWSRCAWFPLGDFSLLSKNILSLLENFPNFFLFIYFYSDFPSLTLNNTWRMRKNNS